MNNYIIIGIISFVVGFLIATIIFKSKNTLSIILKDFKNTLDEYKFQNEKNAIEIKNAISKAAKLSEILTTNQNLKGNFGEECLESIIKTCYPNENISYIKQFNGENENNEKIRPDLLINLPNNKTILIDCKLKLDKFIEYKEANEEIKIEKKKDFIKDLNNTINTLSNKKYETLKDIIQPNFILMYIPLEPVITHIYTDNDFLGVIKNAIEKNIIIVGNSSILTTLNLTKTLWAKEKQEQNIEQIVQIASKIYDLIAEHSQNLIEIKNSIEQSSIKINKEFNKINSGNIFKYSQELKELGINSAIKKSKNQLSEIKINDFFLQ